MWYNRHTDRASPITNQETIDMSTSTNAVDTTKPADIAIGSLVTAPITGADDETSFAVGELITINKRWATIKIGDGSIVRVGKTKIELAQTEEEEDETQEELEGKRIADGYHYAKCRAASGRISVDNADDVAQLLRGNTLDEAYKIVAGMIDVDVYSLMAKYSHLNPGQQRMNIGNRARGFLKRQARDLNS